MITGNVSGIQSVGVTEDNTHKEVINVLFFGARKVWQKFGQQFIRNRTKHYANCENLQA